MKDNGFYEKVDEMFKEDLNYIPKMEIRIKDVKNNKIFKKSEMAYHKVFFDCDLNMYKFDENNSVVKVNNENYKAVIVEL
jgi:ribosomal protein S24E